MRTYLVTGAAGFIGANYVHFLRRTEPGCQVVAVDNLGFAANLANLDLSWDSLVFEEADICDTPAMLELYGRFSPDFVVNFAAESHNDRAISDPGLFLRSNCTGAQVMLECSRLIPVQRHLQVSTIEVYGELPAEIPSFREGSPLNAKTPYSAAKAAGDLMTRAYMQTYPEMDIRLTHCANNYGPYQLPEKLIPLAITNVLRGRPAPLYGDGLQRRDWLHVVDHCRAIHTVLHASLDPLDPGAATDASLLPIFDISARQELTNLEMLRGVIGHLGKDPDEWIVSVPDRPNHDRRYLIDPTKIERTLHWHPTITLAAGIAETVEWYVENRAWWEAVFAAKGELQISW